MSSLTRGPHLWSDILRRKEALYKAEPINIQPFELGELAELLDDLTEALSILEDDSIFFPKNDDDDSEWCRRAKALLRKHGRWNL